MRCRTTPAMPDIIFDTCVPCTTAVTGAAAENFSYDVVGSRESGSTVKDTAAVAYEHDAGNRMRKLDYVYDDYGNQRHRYLSVDHTKFWRFTWGGENRLRRAELTLGGQVVRALDFKYDPFGRRIEKKVEGLAQQVPVPLAARRGYVFACDNRAARREASLCGVNLTGTVGILIKAIKVGEVDLEQANELLKTMTRNGFFVPVERITKEMTE